MRIREALSCSVCHQILCLRFGVLHNECAARSQQGARAAERYRCAIASRRTSIPLQHITGRMYFRMLTLRAEPGVFVVRPETEMVAQHAIDAARTCSADEPVVVDLCTGSGAIALAVATEVPASRVLAVEIDEAACQLAARNIADIEPVRVHLVRADALSALVEYEGRADVVVSNPPYVPGSAHPTQREAQLDPPRALYGGGEDGLVIPRGIMTRARAHLVRGAHEAVTAQYPFQQLTGILVGVCSLQVDCLKGASAPREQFAWRIGC